MDAVRLSRLCFPAPSRAVENAEEKDTTPTKTRMKVVGAGMSRAEKLREMFSGRRSYRQEFAKYKETKILS
jgi:hypothetical protein